MMTPQDIFDGFCRPFPTELVAWRLGATNEKSRKADQPLRGQAFCYVDARAVMDRLDAVVGFDGWTNHYTPGVATSIVCNIGIIFPVVINGQHVNNQWIFKADGAGPSDTEADKGALSDAFKRAAVRWGIGRYLYDMRAPWVDLETDKRGKPAIPEGVYERLNKLHEDFARNVLKGGT